MGPSYSGVFEDWEVAIARKLSGEFLAKHSWIKGYDLEDLVQECLIQWHLARHTYDESKGASRRTYMGNVVRHRLQNILHEQLAEKRRAVYVVSESGTIKPLKKLDTLKAMPLLPGGPIIILSFL